MHQLSPTRITIILMTLLVVAVVGLSACRTSGTGKYQHEILATGDVGDNVYESAPPGQSDVLEREYPGAPPLIPHNISGLVITKDENSCLTCHTQGISLGPDHTATKIPESHYIDIPTGTRSESLQGMRYNCLLCHLPQSPEKPLRE
jgi:nitrate reductase cytochrome c-type subunit